THSPGRAAARPGTASAGSDARSPAPPQSPGHQDDAAARGAENYTKSVRAHCFGPAPARLSERARPSAGFPGTQVGGGAFHHPAHDALENGGKAEHVVGHVEVPM